MRCYVIAVSALVSLLSMPVPLAAQPTDAQFAKIEQLIVKSAEAQHLAREMNALGNLLALLGRTSAAEALWKKYPKADLDAGDAYGRADALTGGGGYAAARAIVREKSIGIHPISLELIIASRQSFLGQKQKALESLKAATKLASAMPRGEAWEEAIPWVDIGRVQAGFGLKSDLLATARRLDGLVKRGGDLTPPTKVAIAQLLVLAGMADAGKALLGEVAREIGKIEEAEEKGFYSAVLAEAQLTAGLKMEAGKSISVATEELARRAAKAPLLGSNIPHYLALVQALSGDVKGASQTLARNGDVIRFAALSKLVRTLLSRGRTSEALGLLQHAAAIAPDKSQISLPVEIVDDYVQWAEAMRAVIALRAGKAAEARQHAAKAAEMAKAAETQSTRAIERWADVALIPRLASRGDGIQEIVAGAWGRLVALIESPPKECCPSTPGDRIGKIVAELEVHRLPIVE